MKRAWNGSSDETGCGDLSDIIVHEVAQPLSAILGDAEAGLRALGDTNALRDILKDIVGSVLRATEIIKRAQTMLRPGGRPRAEAHCLNDLVMSTLLLMQAELTRRNVVVEVDLEPERQVVNADGVQMEEVIVNLITNACEAMDCRPFQQRRLHLATRHDAKRRQVELLVRDTGTGIGPDRERIFDAFVTSKPNGHGLGLAISRFIVAAHGGYLWAEAVPDGALIRLRLPTRVPLAQIDWITEREAARRALWPARLDHGPISSRDEVREAAMS